MAKPSPRPTTIATLRSPVAERSRGDPRRRGVSRLKSPRRAEAPSRGRREAAEEPAAEAEKPKAEEKKKDVIPGADLEPIAVEPEERPLSAEERARQEAEEEERARREAELTGEAEEEPSAASRAPAKMESDARFLATGKRKRSIARVTLLPGNGKIEINERELEEFFPRPLHQTMAQPAADHDRLRGQRRRPRPRPRRRHQRPGRRRPPRDRPGADRDRPRAARRAEAPRLPDPRRAGQGAPQGRAQEGAQAAAVQQALSGSLVATERRLFGTDGVRGEAGTFLTAELATALGRAAASSLEAERPQVLIVRDTRESGPMLEAALAAGIAAAGGDALLGGVLPTPAAAILVRRLGLDLAAVVSASHNPFRDNGIKFFSAAGTKLDDEAEARIEALVEAPRPRGRRPRAACAS